MRIATFAAALRSDRVHHRASLPATGPNHKTHTVTIEGMRFQPEVLDRRTRRHDRVGQQGSGSSHGDVEGRRLRFEGIQADKSWRFTVRKKGDFAYICTFHPTMTAMLRVKYWWRCRIVCGPPCHLYVPVRSDQ